MPLYLMGLQKSMVFLELSTALKNYVPGTSDQKFYLTCLLITIYIYFEAIQNALLSGPRFISVWRCCQKISFFEMAIYPKIWTKCSGVATPLRWAILRNIKCENQFHYFFFFEKKTAWINSHRQYNKWLYINNLEIR